MALRRVALIVALLALPSAGAAPAAAARRTKLDVGRATLHRCPAGVPGWCGSLRRALDPARPRGARIGIGYEWLPASGRGRPKGTVVAVEGGPGFPSSGSVVEYTGTYRPLLRRYNLLLVDQRGTGMSALITCSRLQHWSGPEFGERFAAVVGGCGQALDRKYRDPSGRRVHASDLFTTAFAAADLRAVLRRLSLAKVDLYGDSYGTWFAQAFVARYPGVLRSVVLDSSYPVRGLDPYYASSGSSARAALDRVCARDPGCTQATAGAGSAVDRLAALVARVRAHPIVGSGRPVAGKPVAVRVTPRRLVDLVQDSGSDPVILRELDAAVRAALAGDTTPLLRLIVQADEFNGGYSPPGYFSDGMYFAVGCPDYPQLFPLSASLAGRRTALARSKAAAPQAFAPFAASEWLQMSAYSETYDACLRWPRPVHRAPVLPAKAPPLPASVPALFVGGDLDSLTPLSDVPHFAPGVASNRRIVTLRNTVHVTSEGDTDLVVGADCARRIIRAFTRAPGRLHRLDASCAAHIPAVHTPGAYPTRLAVAAAATLVAGHDPGANARRATTVAANALADAAIRRYYGAERRGPGLRGGYFTAKDGRAGRVALTLHAVRFTRDTRVSGTASWRPATGGFAGMLTVRTRSGRRLVRVRVSWTQRSRKATGRIADGVLEFPAP